MLNNGSQINPTLITNLQLSIFNQFTIFNDQNIPGLIED